MTQTFTAIDTPRLTLICCTKEIIEELFKGDEALAKHLGVHIEGQGWNLASRLFAGRMINFLN